jgi:SHS2 domain-containing protein
VKGESRVEKYRFFEHTADAKFQAYGATLEEAFAHAVLATVTLMWDWKKIENKTERKVEVEGKDLKQLLASFLEEILYLLDSKNFLTGVAEKISVKQDGSRYVLKALFKGDIFSDKYEIYGDVKAITYSEMKIEDKNGFMVQVVVDM